MKNKQKIEKCMQLLYNCYCKGALLSVYKPAERYCIEIAFETILKELDLKIKS